MEKSEEKSRFREEIGEECLEKHYDNGNKDLSVSLVLCVCNDTFRMARNVTLKTDLKIAQNNHKWNFLIA